MALLERVEGALAGIECEKEGAGEEVVAAACVTSLAGALVEESLKVEDLDWRAPVAQV